MAEALRVVSHGGGRQTTAMLVLAATGRLDYQTFLFANVGDDSEYPGTLTYLDEIARPYAEAHGITIHELHKVRRGGQRDTLYRTLQRSKRSIDIPVRMANGAPGNRNCTYTFKIKVVGDWLVAHGASEDNKATVAVGLSVDEVARASNRKVAPYEIVTYPLFDLGLSRRGCEDVIRGAGLPLPPKSSCWFCPHIAPVTWQHRATSEPELFARACDLEAQLIARRIALGKDAAYFTRYGKPLAQVVNAGQGELDDDTDEGCDNGGCMT